METDSSQEECDKDVTANEGDNTIRASLERTAAPPEMAHVRESMSSLAIMEHPIRTEVLPPSLRLTRRILSCRRTKRCSGKERNSATPSPSRCTKRSSSSTARYTLTLAPVPSTRKPFGSCPDAAATGGCKSKRKAPNAGSGGTTSDDHCPLVRLKKRITCFVSAIVSPTSCSLALPPATGTGERSLGEDSITTGAATPTDDIVPTVPAIVLSTADDLNAVTDASHSSVSFNPAGCNSSSASPTVQRQQLRSPNAKL